jgi:hypothetical protein
MADAVEKGRLLRQRQPTSADLRDAQSRQLSEVLRTCQSNCRHTDSLTSPSLMALANGRTAIAGFQSREGVALNDDAVVEREKFR